MNKKSFLCLFLIPTLGCATLTKGPMKRVTVNSNPTGAVVKMESGAVKSTPCLLHFPGFVNQTILIEKAGYEPAAVLLTKRFLARVWWNLLFWPGFIVDFATGSAWVIEPETVNVALQKK